MANSFRIIAPGLPECQNKCFHDNRCISYNLSPIDGTTRTCELNDLDHMTHPDDVIDQKGSKYCPIQVYVEISVCCLAACFAHGFVTVPSYTYLPTSIKTRFKHSIMANVIFKSNLLCTVIPYTPNIVI